MARLLVVESWVGAVGLELPTRLARQGHLFVLATRDPEHYTRCARDAGVLVGDEHPLLASAGDIVVVDTNAPDGLCRQLQEYHRRRPVDGVLTTCDYYLEAAARVAEALELAGPSVASMHVARYKHLTREACRRAGLPGPRFVAAGTVREAAAFASKVGFPLVVKAPDLCASESVTAVHSDDELAAAVCAILQAPRNIRQQTRPGLALVEELLEGPEFSVEACCFRGEIDVWGITDKSLTGYPGFIESGVMFPADLAPGDASALQEYARAVLIATGYDHGLAHTEIKLTAGGPRLVELNPRMGGGHLFDLIELVAGIDPFVALVDLALDRRPQRATRPGQVRSAALRFLLPPGAGRIAAIDVDPEVAGHPDIRRVVVSDVIGKTVRKPVDNGDFLGHVVAVDPTGSGARQRAEWAASRIAIRMEPP